MSDSLPTASRSESGEAPFRDGYFWGLPAFTVLVQVSVLIAFRPNLTDDRDAYLALARQLSQGNGFRSEAGAPLTAYRPPLYPVALSIPMTLLPESASVAAVNLFFAVLTVILVWKIARERGTKFAAAGAAFLVCFDPLLLSNVALPMTETMFTGLVAALVYFAIRPELTARHRIAVGVLFGLSALCRPTVWAFGFLAGCSWLIIQLQQRPGSFSGIARKAGLTVLSAVVVLAPWAIRNAIVFREFIPLTTHGGYTLLLANNSVFYEEVVQRSWRTTWEGESLSRWQRSLETEMAAESPPIVGETERDRWMSSRAKETISQNPGLFLRSCLTRFLRFWNPVPISTPERPISGPVGLGIGIFSCVLFMGTICSGFPLRSFAAGQSVDWLRVCAWCLIIAMTLVHLIYWSNMRMRTPLEPFLALLAIGSFGRFLAGRGGETDGDGSDQRP